VPDVAGASDAVLTDTLAATVKGTEPVAAPVFEPDAPELDAVDGEPLAPLVVGDAPATTAGCGVTASALMFRLLLYEVSAASAAVGLSVYFAACSRFPDCHAVRNAAPVCSAAVAGSLLVGWKLV
jgi:hypothetical protein